MAVVMRPWLLLAGALTARAATCQDGRQASCDAPQEEDVAAMLQQQPWAQQHGDAAPSAQAKGPAAAPWWSQAAAPAAASKQQKPAAAPWWSHEAAPAAASKWQAARHQAREASPFGKPKQAEAHAAPWWSQHEAGKAQHRPGAVGWMHGMKPQGAQEAFKHFAPHHKLSSHAASLAAAPWWGKKKTAEAVPAAAAKWKQAVEEKKKAWQPLWKQMKDRFAAKKQEAHAAWKNFAP
eukprot:CAMPEP_0176250632 /NCGR_PEP_ID=MMETSP0121_2-20121125/34584_1 /TAXON_ID=160619 /ORGANISM="Kryptoperidinium foliaceum, Strain CCMP 1326" /LENGTH=235 /DNA_ID=CAMNT_0017590351 /DNA_START=76 /DNA_END=779 /DNA_ORIENTATION=+